VDLYKFCEWVEQTPIAAYMRYSPSLYAITETVHTLGIILVAGTIMVVDLRLLGKGLRSVSITELVSRIVPWTLAGFGLMFVTGAWLWASEARRLYHSPVFETKLVLLALAGLNALVFHLTIYRSVGQWNEDHVAPARARLAGAVSLLLWIAIIVAGRSIAYGPGYES